MSSRFGATMGGADKLKPLPEQDEELPVDEPLPAVELGEMDEQPEDAGLDRRLVRCDRPGDNKLIKLCVDNRLSSRKYPSWLLFVPMNLFEQFCRVANIYQLCIAVLYMIPIISPASNGYPNIGGLAAMVGATMAKDGYEDARRASSDAETNSRPCVVYSEESGQWEERNWGSLWPGTLIQVHENEQVPADMMILGSLKFNHEDPEAFLNDNGAVNVSTKGLDGETTLKARQAGVQDLRKAFWREPHVGTLQKHVRYVDIPAPNGDIDNLEGEAVLNDGRKVHIYRSGFMLRGTVVEQTHKVWGMVLYTGEQSKLVMNNRMTIARKVTQVEHRMNLIVMWVFAVTVCVCITLSVAMAFWSNIDGPGHWYLQLQYNPTELFTELEIGYFNPDSPALVAIIGFGTWMILQSVMIPLVLPLTIDGIKLLVGNWVAWDLGMYDEDMDQSAQVKNSSVIEDLGQVQYVVSDKTGTLTQNKMALLKLSTGGPEMYGEGMTEVDLEIKKQENPNMSPPASPRLFESSQTQMRDFLFYDRRISDYAWLKSENNGKLTETERQHAEDLLLAMSLCHEVVPLHDESSEHKIVYSAQSPDDSALVLAARHLGFEFAALESNDKGKEFKVNIACGRSEQTSQDVVAGLPVEPAMELSRHVTKVIQRQQTLVPSHPMQFQQHSFQVLYSLKFTSHLKRAGVVVRMPDGSLKVFLKGADSVIIEMLEKSGDTSERLKHTMDHVTSMAASGLRTMMYASREMSQEEFDNWAPKWEMILQAEKSGKMPQTLKAPDAGSFTPRTLAVSPRKYSSMSPKEQIEAQMQALRDQAEVGLAHGGGLHVLGAVGIEDRLQENVGHVLATLADSGVHTWMCTGDKVETAVMIGHACQLLRPWPKMDLVYLGPVKMDQVTIVLP